MSRVELPHVDVMCLTACGLKCVACTNGMGIVRQEVWPYEQVKADIDTAAMVMHAEVACLLGGEPLAHPRIVDLMRHANASDLSDRVQVLTNGMRLHLMPDEFWAELDWLKISIYPGKTQPENIKLAHTKRREHGFHLDFYDVAGDPFRAVHTPEVKTPQQAQATFDGCWYKTFTRKIEQGYFFRCCTSPHISKTILGLGPDADGIKLDTLTPEALQAFLDRQTYMNACTRCHGHLGPRLGGWSEQRDRSRWLEESAVA